METKSATNQFLSLSEALILAGLVNRVAAAPAAVELSSLEAITLHAVLDRIMRVLWRDFSLELCAYYRNAIAQADEDDAEAQWMRFILDGLEADPERDSADRGEGNGSERPASSDELDDPDGSNGDAKA